MLVGEGAEGIARVVAVVDRLRGRSDATWKPLVLLGSDRPFPFRPRPSQIFVPAAPAGTIACMPLLDAWDIPSRLASTADLPGCFEGTVTELADAWLASLGAAELSEVELVACDAPGVAALAQKYSIPCQLA